MPSLRQKIEHEIRQRGPIPFSRYMGLCLYDPEHGYYCGNAEQFGKAGDFYTASDVHAVFGRLMARQFEQMWRVLGSPDRIAIVELGPGRGLLAQDVLAWSEKKFPDFFQALRYLLVERSAALGQRIEATLCQRFESGKAAFASLEEKEEPNARAGRSDRPTAPGAEGRKEPPSIAALTQDMPTIFFANEFFDALPVEIVGPPGSLRIDIGGNHFIERWMPASSEELEHLDRFSIHPEPGERLEVPLMAQRCMQRIASTVNCGFVIAIDYGYTREEQLAGRHRGTLKALRRHSISANPYEAPGQQDITADVNFTALAAAAEQHGMQAQRLLTQSQFLMGIGESNQFADAFEDCRLPQERAKVALQLKHLVTPAGLGESFHVLVASKRVASEKVAALAGLSFGRTT